MKSHAIVLKNYFPKKNKIIILHERFGKITLYIHEKHPARFVCNGSLVYCLVHQKRSLYQCDAIEPYFIPMQHNLSDLYFIHDILKICLYFMPEQADVYRDIFPLLIKVYEKLDLLEPCQRKIYLLRLFLFVGIFPENKQVYQLVMQDSTLHVHDTDAILEQSLQFCWQHESNYA